VCPQGAAHSREAASEKLPVRRSHLTLSGVALLSYFPANLSRYKIFYLCVFFVLCWTWMLSSWGILKRKGIGKDGFWFFAFFGYLLLTAAWAEYPSQTVLAMGINSIFLLVWALSYLMARNYPVEKIAQLFVGVPYVVAGTFVYTYARFGAIRPYDGATLKSFGSIGNAAGLWLGLSLPFLFWLIQRGYKKRRIEVYLALFLILVSESRAAYVLAVFCLLINAVVNGQKISHYLTGTLKALALMTAVFSLAYYAPLTRTVINQAMQRVLVDDVVANASQTAAGDEAVVDAERVWMFEQGWQAFTEHPLLGIGYDNISKRIEENYGPAITSHNLLLTLGAESGMPGSLIFIIMIVAFFKRVAWARRNQPVADKGFHTACMASMAAALLSAMAHPLLALPLFYVLLGVGHGAMRRAVPVSRVSRAQPSTLLPPAPKSCAPAFSAPAFNVSTVASKGVAL
jgi:O-antigen ligase